MKFCLKLALKPITFAETEIKLNIKPNFGFKLKLI